MCREGGIMIDLLPVVRDPYYSLLAFVADKFDLVFDVENRLAISLASCVPDLAFHSAGVSFISIFTQICELHPLFPRSIDWYGTLEVFLAPSFRTAMQAIGTIVGMQRIRFAIEIVYLSVFDAIGGAANGFAKVRGIV